MDKLKEVTLNVLAKNEGVDKNQMLRILIQTYLELNESTRVSLIQQGYNANLK